MRESPHYSPETKRVHLGMTETARLGTLEPLEAMELWIYLRGVLVDLPWPVLTVHPGEESLLDETQLPRFKCPHCLLLFDEPTVEDEAIRNTYLDVDWERRTVRSDYDSFGEYDGLWYSCPECSLPVSLPEGWVEA